MNYILEFIGAMALASSQVYAWCKISKQKIQYGKWAVFIAILVLILKMLILNDINLYIKPVAMVLIAIIVYKILFNEKIKNSIIVICLNYFLILIADAIFGFALILLFNNNMEYLQDNYTGNMIADIFVALLMCGLVQFNIFNKMYKYIQRHTNNIKEYKLLIFLLIIITCSMAGFILTYFKNNIFLALLINIFISFVYAIIVIRIINTKNKYIYINNKYHTNLENLQAQEAVINDYRVMNHENKNNLLTIKGMTNNKKVVGYIESLLDQKEKMSNTIMNQTIMLPEGGMRGLIYSKMLVMQECNIKCMLHVDKKVTKKTLLNISDIDMVNLCEIIGVFIDNAIDECNNIDKKEINISLHLNDNKLIIVISNYYNINNKNIIKGTNIKSNKGEGRGYGLKLVENIIKDNHHITNEKVIEKDVFTQKLYLKIKEK